MAAAEASAALQDIALEEEPHASKDRPGTDSDVELHSVVPGTGEQQLCLPPPPSRCSTWLSAQRRPYAAAAARRMVAVLSGYIWEATEEQWQSFVDVETTKKLERDVGSAYSATLAVPKRK